MKNSASKRPIFAIAGPTCSGKTALGVRLAKHVGGEVVNFDSVQLYKGIEIATAKPSDEEKQGIPHHLIDYVDPNVDYTAADWAADAARVITEIESRGNVPILVGGTGFYLGTLRQPLFEGPKTDQSLRERLSFINKRRGAEYLHKLLVRVDPELAANLPAKDFVRVMRGLEVYFQTGERLSAKRPERLTPPEFTERIKLFVLNPPRAELYEKINERTESHFANGLVEEVKRLLESGVNERGNALGAHAYRRVCEYLRGMRDLVSAIEQSKQDVRNYAKRQFTWFRRENDAIWLSGFGSDESVWGELLPEITAPRPVK
ncbi:MAG: tRNA (adenosine(37)-N6)-dimethylallyltransferase MiaA [Pyrinomonadaceae bacterium]